MKAAAAPVSEHALFAATLAALETARGRRHHGLDIGAGSDALNAAALEHEAHAEIDTELGSRLATLVDAWGLNQSETAIVRVLTALALDPNLDLAARTLTAPDAPGPTLAVVLELAGIGLLDEAATAALRPTGQLLRHGLLAIEGGGSLLSRTARVDDRFVRAVRGDTTPEPALARLLRRPPHIDLEAVADVARALLADEPLVWIHEPLGGTGSVVAASSCARLGIGAVVVDLGSRVTSLGEVLRESLAHAVSRQQILVLAGVSEEDAASVAVGCWAAPVPVVVVATCGWDVRWAEHLPPVIACGRLPSEERRALWRSELGVDDTAMLDRVVGLQMSPEEIVAVAAHARTMAALAGMAQPDAELLRQAARRLGNHGSAGAGAHAATMDDLVLPATTRREMERLLSWAEHRDDVSALGPLHGTGGKANGITALFSGGPGTGKTLAAHVIAESLGMELYQVDLTTVVDKYIGETEKNLERIFREASAMHAVLFFDEADALFGARSGVSDSKDRYANMEVAYLLQRMEKLDGVTILATNLKGNLDPAFARRLHFMINFPDPDAPTRERLWEQHLQPVVTRDDDDPIDVEFLSREIELTGGEIRNVVLAATYDAVGEGSGLGMRHVGVAVLRELSKLGRRPREAVAARFAAA
ncbi:ATP-binding protein [Pseudactinotalea sp.]|uniref:ATP-binding protein n=1 Tax=Pseudactinotalea sp. TaxID=1926260 RepID=UPI003B3A1BE1